MATITVAVKYTNRKALGGRVYDVAANLDFTALKDEIKATGGRFDGGLKVWFISNDTLKALKAKYTVTPADFEVTYTEQRPVTYFNPDRTVDHVYQSTHCTITSRMRGGATVISFNRTTKAEAIETSDQFIKAYLVSDEKMIEVGKQILEQK